MATNKAYLFTLLLIGPAKITADMEDQLFEAGCNDATLSLQWGGLRLDFSLMAANLAEAIITAIRAVESIDTAIKVVSIEPADSVTQSELARRLAVTRAYIRLLINGERGSGDFPQPIAGSTTQSMQWSWWEVWRWWCTYKSIDDTSRLEHAETIRVLNTILAERQVRLNYKWQHLRNEIEETQTTLVQEKKAKL